MNLQFRKKLPKKAFLALKILKKGQKIENEKKNVATISQYSSKCIYFVKIMFIKLSSVLFLTISLIYKEFVRNYGL